MTSGYSGTPLPKKLGIKEGHRVALLSEPQEFRELLVPLPDNTAIATSLRDTTPFDVVVLFTKERAEIERRFNAIVEHLDPAGGFWVAWPKKASKVPTDVTEDVVREIALREGLVDNKVCAIDEVWSGYDASSAARTEALTTLADGVNSDLVRVNRDRVGNP